MARKKYQLEYPLGQASPSQVWLMLSTAKGLSYWIDGEITIDNSIATFHWNSESSRQARISILAANRHIRFDWLGLESSFELLLEESDISKELSLHIIDDCEEDDYEMDCLIWQHQVHTLYKALGLQRLVP